ncbi:MAG: patatin family protein [Clostridia bacterium]|nr:patatin family protein [Clostridia bacterium]
MKTGLVLEGGASRASFTNGVIDVLIKEGIKANYVIGTSAGIGNGISYVSGQYRRNYIIGRDFVHDKRYMGKRYLLKKGNKSYYNIDFVFNQIPNIYCPFDYDAFDAFDGEVYACATNMNTGKAEYLPVTSQDKAWNTLLASCALPLFFKPVYIKGEMYMDGGVADSIPYAKALRDGCEKLIVVLTRERDYEKSKTDIFAGAAAVTYRNYPLFAHKLKHRNEIYNAQRERLFRLEKEGKVFIIAPKNTKNFKRTESDPEKLKQLYCQGCRCTRAVLPELKKYLEK